MGTAAMLTSLKNNCRRSKRIVFESKTITHKKSKGITIDPISEKTLKDIKIKIKKQQLFHQQKLYFITSFSIIIIGFIISVVINYLF